MYREVLFLGVWMVLHFDLLIDRSYYWLSRGFLWRVFASCVGGGVAELDLLAHSCSFLLIFAYSCLFLISISTDKQRMSR
jgi:hypothetical protein